MKLRMVPVGPSFRQLQRVVRDAAQSVHKEAELRIEGGDVEVDMTIVDHLRDPLVHMVRNSIGHGIETPDVRRTAGKTVAGQLLLRSFHDAGSIVIELSDDGAGIDRAKVVERAVERGLVADGSSLSDKEVLDLIFHPGLSTAADVTDLSGRGVGLDVVRRNIDAIHGSVTVDSRVGEGTTFRMRLPLTLAIPGETATAVLPHRGESVPFLRLRQRLSTAGGAGAHENAVIANYARGRAGLVVDELHGECQTVVKPLPRALRGIPGLSGSAILPNGGIAFIVDVPALLQVEIDRGRAHSFSQRSNQEKACFTN